MPYIQKDAILALATSQSWVAPAFPTESEWEDMDSKYGNGGRRCC